jgi:hypothetical protein
MKTIHVLCAPCLRDHRKHKIATFDLAHDGPSIHAWRRDRRKIVPVWTTGPDGKDKVHLMCGYGHEVQIRRGTIIAALAAAPDGTTTIPL